MIYGTGIDIIEISRIEAAVKRWGNHFLEHVFTKEEIAYAQNRKFPMQHYAARFAVKEAVLKAFGKNSHISWKDIQIVNDEDGKPVCTYIGKNFKRQILISISHSKHYAVANAIITD